MDELLLSGKKHISARRAAKENGYASDYIGQLIRAGKLAGQKVGRAWYVEEASLRSFLGKPAPQEARAVLPDTVTPLPVSPRVMPYTPPSIARPKEALPPVTYIARSAPLLTYISDREELLPMLGEKARVIPIARTEKSPEEREETEEGAALEAGHTTKGHVIQARFSLGLPAGILAAALLLGLVALSEYTLSYDAKTQVSSSYFSFKKFAE